MDMQLRTIIIMVENEFGALARISSMIRRRGFNIESLSVAETSSHDLSRMTITINCSDTMLNQLTEQLNKLVNVLSIEVFDTNEHLARELLIVRVNSIGHIYELATIAESFGAKIIEATEETITFEITDNPEVTEKLYNAVMPYGILGVARTGIVAIDRAKI